MFSQNSVKRCIVIDKILENDKLDSVDEKLGCISPENFIKSQKNTLPKIKEILKTKPVIIDGNFYHKEQIEHLIKNIETKHFIFTLKASLQTCLERDSQRERVYGQEAAQAVYNLVSKFDYGILIDTENKSADEVVNDILSKL